jgi:DNA-binding beta-propeller fold protein YncE/mono/diheme cytochrome c family protein
MRSTAVLSKLGVVAVSVAAVSALTLTFGAGCGGGETMRALEHPPSAIAAFPPAPKLVSAAPTGWDGTGSSIALATLSGAGAERRLALVADADGKAVRMLDTQSGSELPQLDLSGEPSQVLVGRDGRVFVSVRDQAEIDVLEASFAGGTNRPSLRVTDRIATAEEPVGLALTPDGSTLLVACGWGRSLDAFSTRTLAHAFRAPVAREPRAVVTSADGRRAYVSHATASVVSVVDLMSPDHDVRAQRMEQADNDGNQAKLAWRHGFALARATFGILEPGVEVNTGDTTVRSETYGGTEVTQSPAETFDVAVIDEKQDKPVADGTPDPLAPPRISNPTSSTCMLPRAAAYDWVSDWLFVACQGKDTVVRADLRPGSNTSGSAEWNVGAEPTGLAIDRPGQQVFVWSQASRTVTTLPLDGYHPTPDTKDGAGVLRVVGLGARVDEPDMVARGRALFHASGDDRISSDGRACASCHPDGRDDGLVWATPNGPRQTPTLAGRLAGTAPYGWNGSRATVKKHLGDTVKRLGGTGLDGDDLDALVAYCMTMKAPPRAAQARTEDAALVAEGHDVFESGASGCSGCHLEDGTFTDGNRHNVGSKAKGDVRRRFDTPSLRFLSGTGPYFHDGRYPTLRALLVGVDGKMGHTKQLSSHELDALEAYLQTL